MTVEHRRIRGRISWINKTKGYGFITSLDIPFEKIYFYWEFLNSDVKFLTLRRKDEVEFDVIDSPDRGYQARNISRIASEHEELEPVSSIKEAKTERIK